MLSQWFVPTQGSNGQAQAEGCAKLECHYEKDTRHAQTISSMNLGDANATPEGKSLDEHELLTRLVCYAKMMALNQGVDAKRDDRHSGRIELL